MATTTATVTGKIGPGNTLTAVALPAGIEEFSFNPTNRIFGYRIGQYWSYIDISAATTITCTLSAAAGNYTLTIS